ncbi:MAG TPA: hypothetical protein VIM64_22380, partial [Puia sp.]
AASGWLQPQEVQYLAGVQQKVADKGQENVLALRTLVREGASSMTDGERLQRIRDQQSEIHSRYIRVVAYMMETGGLITGRAKERGYAETLKTWYGIE